MTEYGQLKTEAAYSSETLLNTDKAALYTVQPRSQWRTLILLYLQIPLTVWHYLTVLAVTKYLALVTTGQLAITELKL